MMLVEHIRTELCTPYYSPTTAKSVVLEMKPSFKSHLHVCAEHHGSHFYEIQRSIPKSGRMVVGVNEKCNTVSVSHATDACHTGLTEWVTS